MKVRVLFGVGGFAFVLLALYAFPPFVLEIVLALLCALATYEFLAPTKMVKNRKVILGCMLFSLLFALNATRFMLAQPLHNWVNLLLLALLLLTLFCVLLKNHATMQFSEVAAAFFGTLLIPYLLLSLERIFQMEHGNFLVLMPLLAAWGSDTFAYFFGRFFGKHKLAPVVSPKKTVEGAVGGVLGGVVCVLILTVILNRTLGMVLPYFAAVLLGALGSVIGQIGDLSFSVIKRQTGVKDYGSIFPGHGGVLDRFDSVIFVAPVAEALLLLSIGA